MNLPEKEKKKTDTVIDDDCDPCRLNVGAAVMINLCKEVDSLKDKVNCKQLVSDYEAGKITSKEIIDKISDVASESKDKIALDLVGKLRERIFLKPEPEPEEVKE